MYEEFTKVMKNDKKKMLLHEGSERRECMAYELNEQNLLVLKRV